MRSFIQDLRYALRVLMKNPGFTVIAVIVLTLGIGANSAMFTIVNQVLFKQLPVKDPGELVAIGTHDPHIEVPVQLSYPNYEDIRDRCTAFSDAIAYQVTPVSFSAGGTAERLWLEMVSGNYFQMLGVDALIGRTLVPTDSALAGANPVVVLNYKFWQRKLGGDPSVVGKLVQVNGKGLAVVGVMPASFTGLNSIFSTDGYIPAGLYGQTLGHQLTSRSQILCNVLARLKHGVNLQQASSALNLLGSQLEAQYPATNKGIGFICVPETRSRPTLSVGAVASRVTAIFMVLAGLILLIACMNVANLMMVRAASRGKELAIRTALGARRSRLLRLLLTESVLISFVAGIMGSLLALWTIDLVSKIRFAGDFPVRFNFTPDLRVLAFTAFLVLVAGIASGLAPALQASATNLVDSLKEGARGSSTGPAAQRFRSLLVAGQISVSLLLLVSAGLFVRSLQRAAEADLGFRKSNLLLCSVDVGLQGYDQRQGTAFYKELLDRVRSLAGVISAAIATQAPFPPAQDGQGVYIEGDPRPVDDARELILRNVVGLDYFRTSGMALLTGRDFSEHDKPDSTRVAIVNETMARRFWPGEDPLGKRFRVGRDGQLVSVVGVARNSQYVYLGEDPRPFMYMPISQNYASEITLQVYTAGDPVSLIDPVKQEVRRLDKDLPVYDVKTITEHLRNGIALLFVRMAAVSAAVFGGLALVLATVGIYGVVSYTVSRRLHEVGIRMALGADRYSVLGLVIKQGMVVVAVGLLVGLVAALMLARLLTSLLYGIDATDPVTFAVVSLLLAAAAFTACFIPAIRATRVDPMSALRVE